MDVEMRPNPGSQANTNSLTEFYGHHSLTTRNTIRVLDLEAPQQNGGEDDVRGLGGRVRVVSLSDSPSFAALSYVCGPYADPVDVISCGEYQIPVTRNCQDALRHLRELFGPLTVWVDAICINQGDSQEKSQQIELMGKYSCGLKLYTSGSELEVRSRMLRWIISLRPLRIWLV
jgi:hypothetical protein